MGLLPSWYFLEDLLFLVYPSKIQHFLLCIFLSYNANLAPLIQKFNLTTLFMYPNFDISKVSNLIMVYNNIDIPITIYSCTLNYIYSFIHSTYSMLIYVAEYRLGQNSNSFEKKLLKMHYLWTLFLLLYLWSLMSFLYSLLWSEIIQICLLINQLSSINQVIHGSSFSYFRKVTYTVAFNAVLTLKVFKLVSSKAPFYQSS